MSDEGFVRKVAATILLSVVSCAIPLCANAEPALAGIYISLGDDVDEADVAHLLRTIAEELHLRVYDNTDIYLPHTGKRYVSLSMKREDDFDVAAIQNHGESIVRVYFYAGKSSSPWRDLYEAFSSRIKAKYGERVTIWRKPPWADEK